MKTPLPDPKLRFALLNLPAQEERSLAKACGPIFRPAIVRSDLHKTVQSSDPLGNGEGRYLARAVRVLLRVRRYLNCRASNWVAGGKCITGAEKQQGAFHRQMARSLFSGSCSVEA